ncbi:MAG: hypothetical protein AAGH64_09340 [Planctomycetota bacterium]
MPRRTPALVLITTCLVAVGCSNTPSGPASQTTWIPSSAVSLATIQRDTSVALRSSNTTDTLVFEETGYNTHGLPGARRTWYVQIPSGIDLGAVVRFGTDDDNVIAWFREELPGEATHAVRASGSVRVDARTDEGVDATVVLTARTGGPTPGEPLGRTVNATRRATWVYDAPGAPVTPALGTNAG